MEFASRECIFFACAAACDAAGLKSRAAFAAGCGCCVMQRPAAGCADACCVSRVAESPVGILGFGRQWPSSTFQCQLASCLTVQSIAKQDCRHWAGTLQDALHGNLAQNCDSFRQQPQCTNTIDFAWQPRACSARHLVLRNKGACQKTRANPLPTLSWAWKQPQQSVT